MFSKLKSENGSIIIEATISLSAFMFAIVTILTIVNICIVQSRMAYAINMTAKEISQYSYLYSLTGFNNTQNELYQAGQEGTESLEETLGNVNEVFNEIENLGGEAESAANSQSMEDILSSWNAISSDVESTDAAIKDLENSLSEIADDPKSVIFGLVKLTANESFDVAKSRLVAAPLAKVMVQKHLVNSEDGNVNDYLKFLGVVPNATGSYIDGLNFNNSLLFPNGSDEIMINVEYDVKVIALLPIDFEFHFSQNAITHGWGAGDGSSFTPSES